MRTASSANALATATEQLMTNGAAITSSGNWLDAHVHFSRPVPEARGARAAVARGRGWVTDFRRFLRPAVDELWADYR